MGTPIPNTLEYQTFLKFGFPKVQKQNGHHFVNHWNTKHHQNKEQTPTIQILIMFNIPAPTVLESQNLGTSECRTDF